MTDSNHSDNRAKREKIISKVQALLAKTVAAGCSEQEAMSAAAMADDLMRQYDLSYTDIEAEVEADVYGARKRAMPNTARRRSPHEVNYCVIEVAKYWDCRAWQGKDGLLVFFGERNDTENAHQMIALLQSAMDAELGRYNKSPARPKTVHGKTIRTSFMMGMVRRLNERLRELKAARSQANAPRTGTALVVVKTQVVNNKFTVYARDNNIKIRVTTSRRRTGSDAAYGAGQFAAGRVDLNGSKISGTGQRTIGAS